MMEMGYGRFGFGNGNMQVIINGKACPMPSMADARIERWPATEPTKKTFLQYAGNPGHPFCGKIDNGYLVFIPASYKVQISQEGIGPEFTMPDWWTKYLIITNDQNETLYGEE